MKIQPFTKLSNLSTRTLVAAVAMLLMIAMPTQSVFASQSFTSVTVGTQTGGLTYGTPGIVTFGITVACTVNPPNGNNAITVSLSTSGLPAGVTPSFSPTSVTFAKNTCPTTVPSTLTLSTSSTAPAGTTIFTVTATDGITPHAGPGSLTIDTRPITVTAQPNTKLYDGTTSAAAVPTRTSGTLASGDVGTYTETYDNANVGTSKALMPSAVIVNGSVDVTSYYNITLTNNTSGVINKATPTLLVTNSPVTFNGAAQSATAAGSVLGTVSNVLYDGVSIVPTNVGTYAITADFAPTDSANYNSLTGASAGNFVIGKATPTVSVTGGTFTYTGNSQAASGFAYGVNGIGDVLAPAVTISYIGMSGTTYGPTATAPTNAGTYSATASFAGNANYASAFNSAPLTINKAAAIINVTPYSVTFDTAAHTATGSATGVGSDGPLTGLVLSGTMHTNAGTYGTDAWTFTDVTGNYNDDAGTVSDSIGKATAVIAVTPYSVTYDTTAHTATGSATGVGSDGPLTGLNLSGTTHTNAGTYGTDAWTFTDVTGNYNDDAGTVSDSIAKATPTLTVTNSPVTYSSSPQSATISASVAGGTPANVQYNSSLTVPTNAATYAVTADFAPTDTTNYESLTGASAGSFVISKADAVCTINGYSVPFDGSNHTATGSCTGVGSDGTLSTPDLSASTHSAVGEYDDAWTFTDGTGNYNNANGTAHDIITAVSNTPVIAESDPVSVSMSVNGNPTAFALTLHANDADALDTLTWGISGLASHGTASISSSSACAAGTGICSAAEIGYDPTTNYIGSDSFMVQVSDGTNTASVTVNVAIGQLTLTVPSSGLQDGWILESGEFTGLGGTKNAGGMTFKLGDEAGNQQYRSILSFNTSLPSGAVVTQITLQIKQSGAPKGANPFLKLGNIAVDIKNGNFGKETLQLSDFSAKPTTKAAFTITNHPVTNWYSGALVGAQADTLVNKAGNTQFRLRFTKDDNNNLAANYLKFLSGNSLTDQPQLIIQYYLP